MQRVAMLQWSGVKEVDQLLQELVSGRMVLSGCCPVLVPAPPACADPCHSMTLRFVTSNICLTVEGPEYPNLVSAVGGQGRETTLDGQ